MRISFLLVLFLLHGSTFQSIHAEDPAEKPAMLWQAPFTAWSEQDTTNKIVLMLVTNDNAFRDSHSDAKKTAAETTDPSRHGWCAPDFEKSCKRMLEVRPDLKNCISLQSIFAGTPLELSGGKPANTPSRVVLFVCDGNYRILALSVGIPSADELTTLVEDAQEAKLLLGSNDTDRWHTTTLLVQRSKERIGRVWNLKLDEVTQAKEKQFALIRDGAVEPPSSLATLRELFIALQPTFIHDAQLRFGLSTELDARRLVILEQHTETRDPWSQALTPFIAGMELRNTWKIFVEFLWQQCAVAADGDQTDFLTWYDSHLKSGPFVLQVESPSHMQHLPWPPVAAPKHRNGTSWTTTHDFAMKFPVRTITPQQLTVLIRERELKPINFFSPSMARYLLVSSNNRLPQIIREQDLPARFLGLLRRAKTDDKSAMKSIQKEEIR